jgi:cell division protein ZapA
MAQVSVTINGRQYRIGCEDGEEQHLLQLGAELDRRTGKMREEFGEIGDARLSIMAALVLLDELAEAQARIGAAEQKLAAQEQAHVAEAEQRQQVDGALAAVLDAAAARIEKLSRQLNAMPEPGSAVAMG